MTAAPSDPKLSLASTSISIAALSCTTVTKSATAVGVEISTTVTTTVVMEVSPVASIIVYLKPSSPTKPAFGV